MKKCPACGFELSDDARFCEECGAAIAQEKECPMCHAKSRPSAKFCVECGYSFSGNAPKSTARNESVSMGDRNMVAGDVIGKKVVFERGATYIHNEDETRKLVRCHICNQNMAITNSIKCPCCGKTVCQSCYDRSVRLCQDCKEAEYRSTVRESMIGGRIPLEKRIALDKLAETLNLNPGRAKIIEQRFRSTPVRNKTAEDNDPKRHLISLALNKAETLLFDRNDSAAAYQLLKPIHDNDPHQEDILVYFIAAASEAAPEEADGLLQKINADILGVELIRIDQALAGKDVFAAIDLLNKADGVWPGSVLLGCRKILARKAIYDKTGEQMWLDEANAILSSMPEPATKMERSWVEKVRRALGCDLPEPTPAYCREHDLFYFLLNSGSDAFYRLALCHEQGETEYARLILRAAKCPSPSAEVLKQAADCLSAGKGTEKNVREAARLYKEAARQGDAEAQYRIGSFFYKGEGVVKDDAEAANWFRKAAEQGHPEAQYNLGKAYRDGKGADQDDEEAAKWYRKAAEQGHAEAQYELGKSYRNGKGVNRDDEEAAIWFRKAAEQGHSEAQYELGESYRDGKGVTRNDKEAAKWFRKAAEQGHPEAQYELGESYRDGKGADKDDKEAVKWFRKAAEQGHPEAQYRLGDCFYNGCGVDTDDAEALKWYRKAAKQGNVKVLVRIGNCYFNGRGVPRDQPEAVEWYRKGAEQGDAEALTVLGDCYYHGYEGSGFSSSISRAVDCYSKAAEQGYAMAQARLGDYRFDCHDAEEAVKWYLKAVEQGITYFAFKLGKCYDHSYFHRIYDREKAGKWYRKAAEQGDAEGQFQWGYCYLSCAWQDYGLDKDLSESLRNAEAVKWIRKAAEQGHAEAQYELGGFYLGRYGLDRDAAEAAKWWRKAAEQGHTSAHFLLATCTGLVDDVEALKWLRQLAEQDYIQRGKDHNVVRAQRVLGVSYFEGSHGLDKDAAEAVKWWRKAADNEDRLAMFLLSKCYQEGIGVPQNAAEAEKWFRMASPDGLGSLQQLEKWFREAAKKS